MGNGVGVYAEHAAFLQGGPACAKALGQDESVLG